MLLEEIIVVLVRADKKPENGIVSPFSYCPIASADSYRINRFLRVHTFEM